MLIQAPQPDVVIEIGSRLAQAIVTALYLVLSILGAFLAIYSVRLVRRGLHDDRDREIGRIVNLAERK